MAPCSQPAKEAAGLTAVSFVNCTVFLQGIHSAFPGSMALWEDHDLQRQKGIYLLALSLLGSGVTQISVQGTAAQCNVISVRPRIYPSVHLLSPKAACASGMAGSRRSRSPINSLCLGPLLIMLSSVQLSSQDALSIGQLLTDRGGQLTTSATRTKRTFVL